MIIALYTPSTAPLTAIAGTSLLTCQNSTLIDNSSNKLAITSVGQAKPSAINPFGSTPNTITGYSASKFSGSAYFDGTVASRLVIPYSTNMNIGTSDFTIEAWINPTTFSGDKPIISSFSNWASLVNYYFGTRSGASNVLIFRAGDSVPMTLIGNTPLLINTWYHVAARRVNGVTAIYVNGVMQNSTHTENINITATITPIYVGGQSAKTFSGYISTLRITNGTAVYTSNFLPSAAPLTATSNTTLLLKMDSASIVDATRQQTIETIGDVKITNKVVKYGTNSMYFDGVGDYLSAPSNAALSIVTANFTIEGWVYPTSWAGNPVIIGYGGSAFDWGPVNGFQYLIQISASGQLVPGANTAASIIGPAGGVPPNTWTNFAVVRSGTTMTAYINGTSIGSVSVAAAYIPSALQFLSLGSGAKQTSPAGTNYFAGYISDFRVTKGSARYTANFTPPAAALPIA